MSKNKFVGLLSLALLCGMAVIGCGDPNVWAPTPPPTLKSLGIARIAVNSAVTSANGNWYGKPNTDPQKLADDFDTAAGFALLKSSATDEYDVPTCIITNPFISYTTEPRSASVKFAVTRGEIPPDADDYDARLAILTPDDYLWIQLFAKNMYNYYVIKINVEFGEDVIFAIKNHPISHELTVSEWGSGISLSVELEKEYDGFTYQWYRNTFSSKNGQPVAGATNKSYAPAQPTQNSPIYYYVTVTYAGETLTSNSALIRIIDAVTPAPTQFSIGSTRLNYVRGVGGTGSFMFRTGDNADASPDADVNYIDLLCGTLGINVLRIMVQDDYLNYMKNSVQSRNRPQFFHDAEKNFLPVIRRVNEAGGYVFANPWTAPEEVVSGYWLKTSAPGGSTQKPGANGGHLRTTGMAYVDYANHLRGFLTWLNENNAPIFALGILNEPDYGGSAAYEGMGMSPEVMRNWFRVAGHFPTKVANRATAAENSRGTLTDGIIPGYGGGAPTHHVLAMMGDPMGGNLDKQFSPTYEDLGDDGANNSVELWGRHYYGSATRFTPIVGTISHTGQATTGTAWENRDQMNYRGPYEAESLGFSPQMFAPGSTPGNIKRELWQTEHDFNYNQQSVVAGGTPQKYWNSAFAAMNDIDWCFRVAGESVFDWWFSSSYSGFVTSWHSVTGGEKNGTNPNPARTWGPYTITPRGRAVAHYARYVNETWLLDIKRDRAPSGTAYNFNTTYTNFNAGGKDPKIGAFEDVNGKFISIVMFTPNNSTNTTNPDSANTSGMIGSNFGTGGLNGSDIPTTGYNIGRIAVVMPEGFVASSATALRSYGHVVVTASNRQSWDDVPTGTPRYWIDEPVFLSTNEAGNSVVETTLPGGNIISIKVMGTWPGRAVASPERPRPYDRYQNNEMSGPIMVEGMSPPAR